MSGFFWQHYLSHIACMWILCGSFFILLSWLHILVEGHRGHRVYKRNELKFEVLIFVITMELILVQTLCLSGLSGKMLIPMSWNTVGAKVFNACSYEVLKTHLHLGVICGFHSHRNIKMFSFHRASVIGCRVEGGKVAFLRLLYQT